MSHHNMASETKDLTYADDVTWQCCYSHATKEAPTTEDTQYNAISTSINIINGVIKASGICQDICCFG